MLLADTGEKLITNYTPAERRGSEAYKQIRDKVNRMRLMGQEPKAVWIGRSTEDDLRALWFRACGPAWDGVIPKYIAGVPCKVGSTGGHDWLLEFYPLQSIAEAVRRDHAFKAVDNPLQGLH